MDAANSLSVDWDVGSSDGSVVSEASEASLVSVAAASTGESDFYILKS